MTYTVRFVNLTLGAPFGAPFKKIQTADGGCAPSPRSMVATPMSPEIFVPVCCMILCKIVLDKFCIGLVSQLEFNVPFQHKYGYIRDERSQFIEDTVEPSVFLPGIISLVIIAIDPWPLRTSRSTAHGAQVV